MSRRLADALGWMRRWRPELGDTGGVAIEAALALPLLLPMLLGSIDFGLAYVQKMAMENAVRAGAQLALVRHPALGPGVEYEEAQTSIAAIKQAVLDASDFQQVKPTDSDVAVAVQCLCPDANSWFECASDAGAPPLCTPFQTFVNVSMTLPHTLMFEFPGVAKTFDMNSSNMVRLN